MSPSVAVVSSPPPAFAEIFREQGPVVLRLLRRLGIGAKDAEDVCQEIFLVVHRRLPAFEGRSSVRTWVCGIAVRVASEHRRRPHHRRELAVAEPPELASAASQEGDIERREALRWLDATLNELDDDKRAVFVLYEIEEMSMQDIAETCGCPLQTAYARLYAARRQVELSARREQARRRFT